MNARERAFVGHPVLPVALYGLAHFALAAVGFGLGVGASNAPWLWPAAGLLPTILAIARPEQRLGLIASAAIAERLAATACGADFLDAGGLILTLANLIEAVAGAAAVAALLPSPWYRRTSVEILTCVCVAALIVPLIGAAANGALLMLDGQGTADALVTFSAWWAADFLGILLINPLIGGVLLLRTVPNSIRRRELVIGGALLVAWTVLAYQITAQPGAVLHPHNALLLLASASMLCLAIAALTLHPLLVASLMFIVALTLNVSTGVTGTLMAQTFSTPDAPHFAARALLLIVALCSYAISLVRFERTHIEFLDDRRRSPHRVIAGLATRLAQCDADNIDSRILESLEIVGRTCGADRCVIFQIDAEDSTFSQSHRWCRPGVTDIQPMLQRRPVEHVAPIIEQAQTSGNTFLLASDVPASSDLARYLTQAEAWAVAYAPLHSDEGVWGLLGLTWQRPTRRWGTDSSVVLQAAAQVIGRTLRRAYSASADAAYRDKLRALTARLDKVDARVRRETAADLHDGAAQALAVARLRLAQIRQHGEAREGDLQAVEEMIVTALGEIRGVIRRMVPSALYDLGLAHALREFVSESREQLDLNLTLTTDSKVDPVPTEMASLLYRAARELITNAIKHADATSIRVSLTRDADHVVLTVRDDGRGFHARRTGQRFADSTGLGLFSLRERLARIGGSIELSSGLEGTRITVTVPLMSGLNEGTSVNPSAQDSAQQT